jgi:hypothetical protein
MMKSLSLLLPLLVAGHEAFAQSFSSVSDGEVADPEIAAIASDAYVFGYPLVAMYVTMRTTTNVVASGVDTSNATWLDLSREPIVVHLPDGHGHAHLTEIIDMWTNVISAPEAAVAATQEIALAGPDWKRQMPAGITATIRSPTNNVAIINRLKVDGATNASISSAPRRQITTTPISSFGRPYTWPAGSVNPFVDTRTSVHDQIDRMSADEFFTTLAEAMKNNRPVREDAAMVARIARIGLRPGSDYESDPAVAADLNAGVKAGMERILMASRSQRRGESTHMTRPSCGRFGTQYLERAVAALTGCGVPGRGGLEVRARAP